MKIIFSLKLQTFIFISSLILLNSCQQDQIFPECKLEFPYDTGGTDLADNFDGFYDLLYEQNSYITASPDLEPWTKYNNRKGNAFLVGDNIITSGHFLRLTRGNPKFLGVEINRIEDDESVPYYSGIARKGFTDDGEYTDRFLDKSEYDLGVINFPYSANCIPFGDFPERKIDVAVVGYSLDMEKTVSSFGEAKPYPSYKPDIKEMFFKVKTTNPFFTMSKEGYSGSVVVHNNKIIGIVVGGTTGKEIIASRIDYLKNHVPNIYEKLLTIEDDSTPYEGSLPWIGEEFIIGDDSGAFPEIAPPSEISFVPFTYQCVGFDASECPKLTDDDITDHLQYNPRNYVTFELFYDGDEEGFNMNKLIIDIAYEGQYPHTYEIITKSEFVEDFAYTFPAYGGSDFYCREDVENRLPICWGYFGEKNVIYEDFGEPTFELHRIKMKNFFPDKGEIRKKITLRVSTPLRPVEMKIYYED